MKMEQTKYSEMSAYKIQMPGNYPEESIQQSEHDKSLKSRTTLVVGNESSTLLFSKATLVHDCEAYVLGSAINKHKDIKLHSHTTRL